MSKLSFFSEIGPRQANEDRLLLPIMRGSRTLMAIADGVGGAVGGDRAAELAINILEAEFTENSELSELFKLIVNEMKVLANREPVFSKMATTLSAVSIKDNRLSLCHVGDTRVYHLRDGGLATITQDQTEIAELLRRGILTKRQAERYSRKNVLLYALSPQDDYEIFISEAVLQPKDRVVLLSDGVYSRVQKMQIAELSKMHSEVTEFVDALKHRVIQSEPRDNFTALVYQY